MNMKMKLHICILALSVAALAAVSCGKEKLDSKSVIQDSTVEMNEFDYWLEANYLTPYNIDFVYRYRLNESDLGFVTIPADYQSSVIYAHLVKYLCIDTYDEVAGISFTRSFFPKMFFLIGEWEYRNTGSIVLGTAEGGKKIMLSGVNYLADLFTERTGEALADAINTYYIKTIHHEFTHIINQTKDFPETFKGITASTYVSDACFDTDEYWLGRGYITAYSQSEPREDFAELLSEYITHTPLWWDEQLATAAEHTAEVRKKDPLATAGDEIITAKIGVVRDYMLTTWGIDIDELRRVVCRRMADVVGGKVDLYDLTV